MFKQMRCLCVAVLVACGNPSQLPSDAEGTPDAGPDGGPAILGLDLLAGDIGGGGDVDGIGVAARFRVLTGIAIDSAGNLYVADRVNTIRKVTAAGVVTTLAGTSGFSGSADGNGAAARFNVPLGVAVDSAGNVYVADTSNHTIRKISAGGAVTTLAGTALMPGSDDGTGAAARFLFPSGVAVDSADNIYVADSFNYTIRKITTGGVVTTLAGGVGVRGSVDGTGTAARFSPASGIAVGGDGSVYVADTTNHTVRKITPAGVVTTIAGTALVLGSTDGTGIAARFHYPTGIAVDGAGNTYVADRENNTIRKVTAAGVVTTMAGAAEVFGSTDGTGVAARFAFPFGCGSSPACEN